MKPFKFKCPCLAESFSGSNDLPPFTSIYNRHITAHHLLFSPKQRVFFPWLPFITALSHVTRLHFTGLRFGLKAGLWVQLFGPHRSFKKMEIHLGVSFKHLCCNLQQRQVRCPRQGTEFPQMFNKKRRILSVTTRIILILFVISCN